MIRKLASVGLRSYTKMIVIMTVMGLALFACQDKSGNRLAADSQPEQKTNEVQTSTQKEDSSKEENRGTTKAFQSMWNYSEDSDQMGRGIIKYARIESLNEVAFDFPYQGSQKGELMLRIHPKFGKDVMLEIQRGHFLCSFGGCSVEVRFDDQRPERYAAVGPSDHDTTCIFIRNYDRFVSKLRNATKLYIEAQFYREGLRVFMFNVAGLEWSEPAKTIRKKKR